MPVSTRQALAWILVTVALGTGAAQQGGAPWVLEPQAVPSPASADSAQPQLTVSDRGVLLSWIERHGTIASLKFSERTSTGWTAPLAVAGGSNWFVNWADVPSVMRLADGTIAAHWLQKSGANTYAYDVRLAYSKDDGHTWSSSFLPHHDGTATEHGFASLFQMPGGGLGLIWLDGRAMQGGHGRPDAGDMAVRFATFDKQWKQTAEAVVDARACECCPTTAVLTSEGPIVAYRNRDADETRDIHVSRYENGRWTVPKAAHPDGWKIQACPVNGPMLSANGRDVVLAWFTVKGDQPRAYAAFSADSGRTFGSPVRLDDGSPNGRVDVELLPDGSAAASYLEHADGKPRFNVRRIDRSGARSPAVTIAALEEGRTSGYPRMARHGDELVFAWVERTDTLRVKTAVAKLRK
jgi:hypothetical protein